MKGQVYVLPLTEFPEIRFAAGSQLRTDDGRILVVSGSREHGARLLVGFEGATDRDAAESLRGTMLWVAEDEMPDLPADRWWPHELIGCAVRTDTGRDLGVLHEVLDTPANDIWVAVDAAGAEHPLPVIDDVVLEVDLEARRVTVADIPGLTTGE